MASMAAGEECVSVHSASGVDDIYTAMYTRRMIRTQLYLDDDLHRRLRELAAKQGRTVSDLVREAVARAYGTAQVDERVTTLEGIASLWQNRKDLGAADGYVRRLRRDTRRSRGRG